MKLLMKWIELLEKSLVELIEESQLKEVLEEFLLELQKSQVKTPGKILRRTLGGIPDKNTEKTLGSQEKLQEKSHVDILK